MSLEALLCHQLGWDEAACSGALGRCGLTAGLCLQLCLWLQGQSSPLLPRQAGTFLQEAHKGSSDAWTTAPRPMAGPGLCGGDGVGFFLVSVPGLIPLLSPPQVYFKTPSGELQTVLLQEAPAITVAPSGTSCSSPVSRSSGTGGSSSSSSSSRKATVRKERTLPKIAPAGGIISLSAAQLAAAAQAMQTININGVQVQGVPVTITNTGGGLCHVGQQDVEQKAPRASCTVLLCSWVTVDL